MAGEWQEPDATISVELSKINFVLENLYALTLHRFGASADDVDDLADEMRRQFTELPATTYGEQQSPEAEAEWRERGGDRLDRFFAGVRHRIQQAPDPDDQ